jgi:hypothetical protein
LPKIDRGHVGLASDKRGCPNRCRPCYLGPASGGTLPEKGVRWGVSRFRDFIATGQTPIQKLSVLTWFREPDFGDDYRQLHALEAELSDCKPYRYELLSVWRLARDDTYARWARSVGPDTCQISFFGMRGTTNWFCRRKGAFDDALTATERLLDAGMKPRWQVFLTTKLLPELDHLLALVDQHRLQQRLRELGGEFKILTHPPGPDYEARRISTFRPTAEVADLPAAILAPTRRHLKRDVLWQPEETLYSQILKGDDDTEMTEAGLPDVLWFFVGSNWDVFPDVGTLEPWYNLGNLQRSSFESIIRRFEEDSVLGLHVQFHASPVTLAERYGDPKGQKVYSSKEDLLSLYRGRHCEKVWSAT